MAFAGWYRTCGHRRLGGSQLVYPLNLYTMAKKKGLSGMIRKNALKTAGPVIMRAGLRTGGAVAGSFLHKKLTDVNTTTGKPMLDPKFAGPGLFLLGLAGEIFIADENIRSVAEGITVVGGLKSVSTFLPDQAPKLGLSGGVGATDAAPKALPADIGKRIDDILAEAEREADVPSATDDELSGVDENGIERRQAEADMF